MDAYTGDPQNKKATQREWPKKSRAVITASTSPQNFTLRLAREVKALIQTDRSQRADQIGRP